MKNLNLVVVLAVAVCGMAEAKISLFGNDQVVAHVLKSAEFATQRRNSKLTGSELASVSISKNGNGSIGTEYTLDFIFLDLKGVGSKCEFDAIVENEKVENGGITSSRLSTPSFGHIKCVQ
jgi:hypothetical protein